MRIGDVRSTIRGSHLHVIVRDWFDFNFFFLNKKNNNKKRICDKEALSAENKIDHYYWLTRIKLITNKSCKSQMKHVSAGELF